MKTIKCRIITSIGGVDYAFRAGEELEIECKLAQDLINGGIAESIEKQSPARNASIETTASKTKTEKAVKVDTIK